MFVGAHRFLDFDARLEREAMDQIADGIAPLFDAPGGRIGLIVASDNAGTATSVQFWADALRTGVAFAGPELFPWCLANAPCGALARRFGITGPNSTLLGEADALLAALDTGEELLAQDRVDAAVIVAVCFASAGQHGRAMALRLQDGGGERHEPGLAALCRLSLRGAIDMIYSRIGKRA